jgi:hypothetical protein
MSDQGYTPYDLVRFDGLRFALAAVSNPEHPMDHEAAEGLDPERLAQAREALDVVEAWLAEHAEQLGYLLWLPEEAERDQYLEHVRGRELFPPMEVEREQAMEENYRAYLEEQERGIGRR